MKEHIVTSIALQGRYGLPYSTILRRFGDNQDKFNDAMASLFLGCAIDVVDNIVYLNHSNREVVEFLTAHSLASDIGLPRLIRQTPEQEAKKREDGRRRLEPILTLISRSGANGIAQSKLIATTHRMDPEDRMSVLAELTMAGKIVCATKKSDSGKGRPSIKYFAKQFVPHE
jgi:hypothetical protein